MSNPIVGIVCVVALTFIVTSDLGGLTKQDRCAQGRIDQDRHTRGSKQEDKKEIAEEFKRYFKSTDADLKARLKKQIEAQLDKKLRGKTIIPPLKETKILPSDLRKKMLKELTEQLDRSTKKWIEEAIKKREGSKGK